MDILIYLHTHFLKPGVPQKNAAWFLRGFEVTTLKTNQHIIQITTPSLNQPIIKKQEKT